MNTWVVINTHADGTGGHRSRIQKEAVDILRFTSTFSNTVWEVLFESDKLIIRRVKGSGDLQFLMDESLLDSVRK